MKRLVVIDGKSVFYRGYYAMPYLSMSDGTPTGGVYGFAAMALEIIKKLEPDYVAVAWDKPKTNIRARKKIYPDYKAGRKPAPPDFYLQIPILHELLEAFGWPLYELDDYEADDIMGALARQATAKNIETFLITSDLDMLQLIGEKTHVYAMKKGLTNIEEFDIKYFEEKYGLSVHQFLDLKSLKGDSSDNLPGVPGIGEKTAVTLLQQYKTLDGVYEHLADIKEAARKKLEAGRESAYISKKVGEIWCDAPVDLDLDGMDVKQFDVPKLKALLEKLEFRSLIRNLGSVLDDTPGVAAANSQASLIPGLAVKKWNPKTSQKELEQGIDVKKMDVRPVLIHFHEESRQVWISREHGDVYCASADDASLIPYIMSTETGTVAYDLKALAHQLKPYSVLLSQHMLHDIRQGAFLLNPLQRDRSLASLLPGYDLNDSGQTMAGLWGLYDRQMADFRKLPRLYKVATSFDFPLSATLFAMEYRGIKLDTDILKKMSAELEKELRKTEQKMYSIVGREFNIASPSQLAVVLFKDLQLPTVGIKKGKTGFSTGIKELEKLRGRHEIIELIEKSRELAKLKNTYIDTLPLLVDKNNRLHTTFNQDVAATGRLSSTDPNLQNIPIRSDIGRRIRDAFVPGRGSLLIGADYSQFELRLAAVLAGDKELIEDFNGELDIHTKTASDVYGVPLAEVTKLQRRAAKVINFGVLYGMSPHGLVAATGMTFGEAKRFIDSYFDLRKPIRLYIDTILENAKKNGYVETYFGRRRPTPDINASNFVVREAARRAAANMPIQGTEADLMKMAMLEVDKKIAGLGEQVLQIHDSILVEAPAKNADKIAGILKSTMENIYPKLGIKLKVDTAVGKNWGEL